MLNIIILGLVFFMTFNLVEKAIRAIKVGDLANKFVFITGCDSGFGKELAIRLDSLGFPVYAGCLTEEGQKHLSENASTRLVPVSLDVTDSKSIQRALDVVKEKLPTNRGLWAIVNNAGVSGPPAVTEMCSMDEFYKTCAVNVFGPIEMCRRFLPLLRREKGRVVNIASVMGRMACATAPYNTSKFAMEGFNDTLRRELYEQGIKVSILEPGYFVTAILNRESLLQQADRHFDQADEEVKAAYTENLKGFMRGFVEEIQERANPDTSLVVDAYTHAIFSRFPKSRYVIGWDARLFFIPLSLVPAGVSDWILHKLKPSGQAKKQD